MGTKYKQQIQRQTNNGKTLLIGYWISLLNRSIKIIHNKKILYFPEWQKLKCLMIPRVVSIYIHAIWLLLFVRVWLGELLKIF